MYDTVIFDLDGTLSDNSEGIIASIGYALDRMGREKPGAETIRRFIGPPLRMSFRQICGMDDEESYEATRLYRERHETVGYLENDLYPGIRALLTALKRRGAYLAVATGKPQRITENILSHFGIRELFDQVEGSVPDSLSNQKAALIRRVLDRHPGRAVMVGDTADDINGALEAGIDAVHVQYGFGDGWRTRSR